MANFRLVIALMIVGLQVSIANPVSGEDEKDAKKMFTAAEDGTNVTKLFTETELQRAENIGLTNGDLMELHSLGLTFEEMVKMNALKEKNNKNEVNGTFAFANEMCTILVPDYKAATDNARGKESLLTEMLNSISTLPRADQVAFYRNSICAYVSQPTKYEMDATAFGMQSTPSFMKFRYFKLKNQNASGMERVKVAKELCCIYKGQDKKPDATGGQHDKSPDSEAQTTSSSLSDDQMRKFDEHWIAYETAKTSQSFEKVCNFFQAENPSDVNC